MCHRSKSRIAGQWLLLAALAVGPNLYAQTAAVTDKDILAIVQRCIQCHGDAPQMASLDLRSRASILQGGNSGPAIIPGHADDSLLIKRVSGIMKPKMPMAPVTPLTTEEISKLKDWINQGALGSEENGAPTVAPAIPADLSYTPSNFPGYKERVIQDRDRQWWSFRKPVRNAAPAVSDVRWSKNPIDAFVKKAMETKGLEAAPQADKRTLIRRAYLDLIGLLPPTEAVEAFVKDNSPDAYQKLVDRLLASPNYGERWGRFWLDVVRYADSSGFEYDRDIPEAWRYRDYVIKAFNEDKPFNQFIVEQMAGDELDKPTNDSLIATTFYRIGPRVRFREKQNPSNRYDYMDDMIRTTFQGFMGLSVNCARCHDHKFDPITRMDYYRSMAMMWGYVDYDQPLAPKAQVEEYEKANAEVERETAPLRVEIVRLEKPYRDADLKRRQEEALKKYPEDIRIAIQTPIAQRTPGQKLLVSQLALNFDDPDSVDDVAKQGAIPADNPNGYRQRALKVSAEDEVKRKDLQAKIKEIEKRMPPPLPMANGVRDGDFWLTPDGFGDNNLANNGRFTYEKKCCFVPAASTKYEVPELHFAATGNDFEGDKKTPEVQPGFLTVLVKGTPPAPSHPPSSPNYPTSGRRRALGEWIASPDNPLTSRVIVNRIWGWHFGTAIVPTPGNFGKMGLPPSNPELLDWLATEFIRQNWSIKQMQRLVMNSETYKMASSFYRDEDAKKDPNNVYLWRFPLHRVEGELVHDMMLSASGQLNPQFGGKPFFPPVAASVRLAQPRGIWELTEEGPATWRRGVYAYIQRGLRYPMFEVFDEPDLNITCERRDVSTVPTQALTMLNNDFMLIQSKFLAERVVKEASSKDAAERIKQLYRITLSREPSRVELNLNLAFFEKQRQFALAHGVASDEAADLAAMIDFAQVILDSDEFIYIG